MTFNVESEKETIQSSGVSAYIGDSLPEAIESDLVFGKIYVCCIANPKNPHHNFTQANLAIFQLHKEKYRYVLENLF